MNYSPIARLFCTLGVTICLATSPAVAQSFSAATGGGGGGGHGGGGNQGSGADSFAGRHNGGSQGPQIPEIELDATCGDDAWLELYDLDDDGNAVPGSYEYACVFD